MAKPGQLNYLDMMNDGSKKSRNKLKSVPVTFLSLMAVLVIVLGWLGWVLLDQDLSLKKQRIRERLDQAAFALEEAISDGIMVRQRNIEDMAATLTTSQSLDLGAADKLLMKGATLIYFSSDGIMVRPEESLRYFPGSIDTDPLPASIELADQVEFQQKNDQAAIELLRPLSQSPDESVRALALMRIGRISRRNGDFSEALQAYELLASLGNQRINSVPASWLARYARCSIFSAENNMLALGAELKELTAEIAEGGHHASASSYRFYLDAAEKWAVDAGQPDAMEGLVYPHPISEMAENLFGLWANQSQGTSSDSGILTWGNGDGYVLGFWTAIGPNVLASIFTMNAFTSSPLSDTIDRLESQGIGWRVADATGNVLLSSAALTDSASSTLRSVSKGGIAFTVGAFETAGMSPDVNDTLRRRILLTGLALILALILVSSYFISRSLRREAEISRLQSEFVDAVSHEFRTPLTSIRQLSELLASGRVEPGDKAMAYYRILGRESARLQRLVEGLLDFGRMEAGAQPYQPELIDCETFLGETVATFTEEYGLGSEDLSLETEGSPTIWIDRESMTRSIWNLLDNAVKYSPESVKIKMQARVRKDKVHITVADRGVGIPAEEHSKVFTKFVRGSAARITHAKGTGMGLAMVKKIIEDHGGNISVRNNPGGGSIFTIVLHHGRTK